MGKLNSKIFIALFVAAIFARMPGRAEIYTASTKNFVKPQYNDKTHLLEYVITGTNAKTEGNVMEITDARIEIIGDDGKTVRGVISTPLAFYNQATQFISGDKPIKFESLSFDASGVGFDASQAVQTLHIRKNVKLVIKSGEDIKSQFAISKGLEKDSEKASDTDKKTDTVRSK
jgi:hypothetical protein